MSPFSVYSGASYAFNEIDLMLIKKKKKGMQGIRECLMDSILCSDMTKNWV